MDIIASSKYVVIVGLGRTGLSIARYLRDTGQHFAVMDSQQNPPGLRAFQQEFAKVNLFLGELDQATLLGAAEIIVSPGVSINIPAIKAAVEAGVDVIGDVELFARELQNSGRQIPVIAITGSNAKTTVTTLVGQMCMDAGMKTAVGGNIGKPVLELLDESADIYILELSSFQLEATSSLKPKVATILNISADHMDRYQTLADYHRAKQRIYFGAETVVVNRDDPLTRPPLARGVVCITFGLEQPDRQGFGVISRQGQSMLAHEFRPLLAVDQLQIKGSHNTANALAALALGHAAGLDMELMLQTLKRFTGLPHRCQWVATIDGVDFINDSKATNPGATLAAVTGFSTAYKSIILIAGGDGKDADFSPLKTILPGSVSLLIVIGRDGPAIAGTVANTIAVEYAQSLQDAVNIARTRALPGSLVLFSPACASFDMFTGYEERGEQFIQAVNGGAA